jgi:hypothetical protein
MESMEGRLMLATIVSDFLTVGLTPAEIGMDTVQPAFTASPLPFTPLSREGGFIIPPFSPGTNSIDYDIADHALTPEENPANSLIQRPTEANINSTNSTKGTNTSDITLSTESSDGAGSLHSFGNFEIEPAVMTSLDTFRSTSGFIGPVVAVSYRAELGRDEGGPISIAAVLTSIRPLEYLESQELGPSQLAVEASGESSAAPRLADGGGSTDRQIYSELARAMVFEIAGGEPANVSGPPRPDHLHFNDQPRDQANPGFYRPVSYHDESVPPPDAGKERVGRSIPTRPATFVRQAGGNHSIVSAPQQARRVEELVGELLPPMPLSGRKSVGTGALPSSSSTELPSAHAQAFENLGEEAEAAADSPAIALSWRSALNATPLLMVLALERIAASNSRRANRHEAFVSTHRSSGRRRTFERL